MKLQIFESLLYKHRLAIIGWFINIIENVKISYKLKLWDLYLIIRKWKSGFILKKEL